MSRVNDLDYLLELWARWIINGRFQAAPCACSPMFEHVLGERSYTSGKGPKDSIEATIEAAVMALAAEDSKSATVIRVEYRVWVFGPVCRSPSQLEKAHSIPMALTSYKRRLAKAREFITTRLADYYRTK